MAALPWYLKCGKVTRSPNQGYLILNIKVTRLGKWYLMAKYGVKLLWGIVRKRYAVQSDKNG